MLAHLLDTTVHYKRGDIRYMDVQSLSRAVAERRCFPCYSIPSIRKNAPLFFGPAFHHLSAPELSRKEVHLSGSGLLRVTMRLHTQQHSQCASVLLFLRAPVFRASNTNSQSCEPIRNPPRAAELRRLQNKCPRRPARVGSCVRDATAPSVLPGSRKGDCTCSCIDKSP